MTDDLESKEEEKYLLKFFLDAGSGICLWASNDLARREYGYPIKLEKLPLTKRLVEEGLAIIKRYDSSIDWSDPSAPTPWSEKECQIFNKRVERYIDELQFCLRQEYEIVNGHRPLEGSDEE